ncbi:FecR family protein [Bacteroides sp. 519]|uniref:FecR family protein n=1 Tax=Bacteroides sp. 519 TaxID=2302937 RepID=UPI0013D68E26|nr:FecR domain-containing protein [Bacteroides sp. 519]NDV57224.1 hypothetical protein [Bacteroides sp. 519]
MKLKQILNNDTEKAWESLNQRLEEDGLLGVETTRKPLRIQLRTVWLSAASVAVLLIGIVSLFLMQNNNPAIETLVLHNGQGEPTLVTTLEDGSTVFLSEETSIEYPTHFADNKREVYLTGDAFFEIARDEECPFVIDTKTALIEVLGTSFSVNSKADDAFSLSVRSGEVRVTSKITGESSHVKAGETALVNSEKLRTIPTTNPETFYIYLDWIYFKDQTLSNVVRIINERNKHTTQLAYPPQIAGRQFNVVLSNESPLEITEIICTALNLSYTQKQDTIYIE